MVVPPDNLGSSCFDFFRLTHIHHDDLGVEAGALEFGATGFGDVAIDIGDHYLRARFGQSVTTRQTNCSSATRNHRYAAIESLLFEVHQRHPIVLFRWRPFGRVSQRQFAPRPCSVQLGGRRPLLRARLGADFKSSGGGQIDPFSLHQLFPPFGRLCIGACLYRHALAVEQVDSWMFDK